MSFGSGAVITVSGLVLSALHVVSDGSTVRGDQIGVQFDGANEFHAYRCLSEPDLDLDTGAFESKSFRVDQALLAPIGTLPVQPHPFALRNELADLGTEVLLAGFSDDVYWPLNFEESFDKRKFEGIDKEKEFKEKQLALRQILVKRAMVGSIWRMRFGNWGSKDGLQTAAYTLDNDISYGGSGGPVVDNHGRLVAIISKRGLGSADKFQIPMANGDYLPKWPTATSHALAHNILTSRIPAESFAALTAKA